MKTFIAPKFEVIVFDLNDVIATSAQSQPQPQPQPLHATYTQQINETEQDLLQILPTN